MDDAAIANFRMVHVSASFVYIANCGRRPRRFSGNGERQVEDVPFEGPFAQHRLIFS